MNHIKHKLCQKNQKWIKVFLNHIKYKLCQKIKNFLNFWFIKMTLFGCYHCFTNSWYFFQKKLEVDWKWFCPVFLQELPEVNHTCGLFSSDFLVKFIPHQFNGIYVCWLHQPRHQLNDVLFHFAFNVPLVEFTSMLRVIILHEHKPLSYKTCSRWDQVMLQYACDSLSDSVFSPLGTNPWLCNWQKPPTL